MPSEPGSTGGPTRFDSAAEIFHEIRTLGLGERNDRLASLCKGDTELETMGRLLLKGDNAPLRAEALGDQIKAAGDTVTTGIVADLFATRVGHYKLLERIGEGDFDAVFLAEQERPARVDADVGRRVAAGETAEQIRDAGIADQTMSVPDRRASLAATLPHAEALRSPPDRSGPTGGRRADMNSEGYGMSVPGKPEHRRTSNYGPRHPGSPGKPPIQSRVTDSVRCLASLPARGFLLRDHRLDETRVLVALR